MGLVHGDRRSVVQLMGRVEMTDKTSSDGKWRYIRVYTGEPDPNKKSEVLQRWDVKVGDNDGSWYRAMIDKFGKMDDNRRVWLSGEYQVTATIQVFLKKNENYVVARGKKKADGSDLAEHPYQLSLSLSCSPYGVEKVTAQELRTETTGSLAGV